MLRSRTQHRPVLLSAGQLLNTWIEAGGSPELPVLGRSFRHRWSAFWFERYATLTAERCAAVQLPSDPIFIVGLWRTGSTVLHAKLARATSWTTPRTWQCFRPADFLHLSPLLRKQASRPMDAGVIETFSAQEDEFAALLLGEDSVYRAFIDPRRMDELSHLFASWRQHSDGPAQAPLSSRWETFLRALLLECPGRLLLKSPNHTFRLPWIASRFPQAKFIWLLRPVDEVMASNERMWSAMIGRYGQWRLDPARLNKFLVEAVVNHDNLLAWAKGAISDRIFWVHFDEIMRDEHLISRVLAYLEPEKDIPKTFGSS